MSQKEMVFGVIVATLESKGITRAEGEPLTLSDENRKLVIDGIVAAMAVRPELVSEKARAKIFADDKSLRVYCSGLLTNWLKKDTRLNGGKSPTTTGKRLLKKVQPNQDSQEEGDIDMTVLPKALEEFLSD